MLREETSSFTFQRHDLLFIQDSNKSNADSKIYLEYLQLQHALEAWFENCGESGEESVLMGLTECSDLAYEFNGELMSSFCISFPLARDVFLRLHVRV